MVHCQCSRCRIHTRKNNILSFSFLLSRGFNHLKFMVECCVPSQTGSFSACSRDVTCTEQQYLYPCGQNCLGQAVFCVRRCWITHSYIPHLPKGLPCVQCVHTLQDSAKNRRYGSDKDTKATAVQWFQHSPGTSARTVSISGITSSMPTVFTFYTLHSFTQNNTQMCFI
jgi:hypothetical protein